MEKKRIIIFVFIIGIMFGYFLFYLNSKITDKHIRETYDELIYHDDKNGLYRNLFFPYKSKDSISYKQEINIDGASTIVIERHGGFLNIESYKNGKRDGLSINHGHLYISESIYRDGNIVNQRWLDMHGRVLAEGKYKDSKMFHGTFLCDAYGLSHCHIVYLQKYILGIPIQSIDLSLVLQFYCCNISNIYDKYLLVPEEKN